MAFTTESPDTSTNADVNTADEQGDYAELPTQSPDVIDLRDSPPAMTRPVFTLEQAAEVTSTSVATMRRKCRDGTFANAKRKFEGDDEVANNPWQIPLEDLLAAGYKVNAPNVPLPAEPSTNDQSGWSDLRLQLQQRELELQRSRETNIRVSGERDMWQAVANERDRSLTNIERVINALPPGESSSTPTSAATVTPAPPSEDRSKPRRWWNRRVDQVSGEPRH